MLKYVLYSSLKMRQCFRTQVKWHMGPPLYQVIALPDLIYQIFVYYEEYIGAIFDHFEVEIFFFSKQKYIRLQVTCI